MLLDMMKMDHKWALHGLKGSQALCVRVKLKLNVVGSLKLVTEKLRLNCSSAFPFQNSRKTPTSIITYSATLEAYYRPVRPKVAKYLGLWSRNIPKNL